MLQVVTAAETIDLTTLETAKAELKPGRRVPDATLRRWIHDASAQVAAYCGRTLASETVRETIWLSYRQPSKRVRLARFPVSKVASVTLDGGALVADADYLLDDQGGFLARLSASGYLAQWETGGVLVATYTAGFALIGALDRDIERATLLLLRHRMESGDRDPTIRSEGVPGVIDTTYWVGGLPGENAAMPPEAAALLTLYREIGL